MVGAVIGSMFLLSVCLSVRLSVCLPVCMFVKLCYLLIDPSIQSLIHASSDPLIHDAFNQCYLTPPPPPPSSRASTPPSTLPRPVRGPVPCLLHKTMAYLLVCGKTGQRSCYDYCCHCYHYYRSIVSMHNLVWLVCRCVA